MTLAFVCVQLNTCLESFQLIPGQNVCHYLDGDKGGRGVKANGDKGGGGVKNWDFYGDIFFEWPPTVEIAISPFIKTPCYNHHCLIIDA